MSNECIELKNIKYKSMLMNGTPIVETKTNKDLKNLEDFLENSKNSGNNDSWSKLNKTVKINKLTTFANDVYKPKKNMSDEEVQLLIQYFRDCLDRKKLQRVKDVDYDKVTGEIKDIPALFYNKTTKHFTLKNIDKRISTLKSLPPKKNMENSFSKISNVEQKQGVGIETSIDVSTNKDLQNAN
jgi:hypothetical protein